MFRVFNAFQLVTLFAALPFGIGWLHSNPFPYSTAAFYTAICVYLILFGVHVAALSSFVKSENW